MFQSSKNRGAWIISTVLFTGVVVFSPAGWTAEKDLTTGYSAEYSDNVTRSATNKVSDITHSLFLDVVYTDSKPALDTKLRADLRYRHYQEKTFEDDIVAVVDGELLWKISPKRLEWYLKDRIRPVRRNDTRPLTPDNIDTINVLNTGPNINIRLGSVDELALQARHIDTRYRKSEELNNKKDLGRLSISHRWSALTRVSGNAEMQELSFDSLPNEEFEIYEAYLRVESKRKTWSYTVDVGGTKTKSTTIDEVETFLGRGAVNYRLSQNSRINVKASHEISDISKDVLIEPEDNQADAGELVADLFVTTRASVDYLAGDKTNYFRFGVEGRERNYQITNNDSLSYGARGDMGKRIGDRTRAMLYGKYRYIEYKERSEQQRDYEAGMRIFYRWKKKLSLVTGISRRSRRSSDVTENYDEHRLMFSVVHRSAEITKTRNR